MVFLPGCLGFCPFVFLERVQLFLSYRLPSMPFQVTRVPMSYLSSKELHLLKNDLGHAIGLCWESFLWAFPFLIIA